MKLFKPSYFKHIWKIVIVAIGLSFIVGQVALYLFYGLQ